jgi:MtN3 and saliva related transmembrane protein
MSAVPAMELLGYVAATLTTASFVPQALHTFRTRNTEGISLAMYSLFTTGIALWVVYGVAIDSAPMILANVITLVLAATILALALRSRGATRRHTTELSTR